MQLFFSSRGFHFQLSKGGWGWSLNFFIKSRFFRVSRIFSIYSYGNIFLTTKTGLSVFYKICLYVEIKYVYIMAFSHYWNAPPFWPPFQNYWSHIIHILHFLFMNQVPICVKVSRRSDKYFLQLSIPAHYKSGTSQTACSHTNTWGESADFIMGGMGNYKKYLSNLLETFTYNGW